MTEIPEDIMVRAESAYDALGRGSDADAHVIARAILAERKRCAEVALREGDKTQPAVGYLISKAIEAGQ